MGENDGLFVSWLVDFLRKEGKSGEGREREVHEGGKWWREGKTEEERQEMGGQNKIIKNLKRSLRKFWTQPTCQPLHYPAFQMIAFIATSPQNSELVEGMECG